ncbi:MAG: AI-2E family transporter [Alphaproteobacteria bacterium]|nr:MAG: AI-2E family transporter [Alphaproteobacteria bacterium]
MALTPGEQLRWWGIVLAVLVLFLWLVGEAILPFVLGAAIAYLLDPLADRLEARGMSRVWATVTITVLVLIVLVLVVLLLLPAIVAQVQGLVSRLPDSVRGLQEFLNHRFPQLLAEGSPARDAMASAADALRQNGVALVNRVLTSSLAVVNFVLLLLVAPVVAFYLLLDWDRMIAAIDDWLPREHAPTIRRIAGEMDQVLAGFVRGQLTVCTILGTFYAVALVVLGLPFGLLIGIFAGLISFIPFVGAILGGLLSVGVALAHFWGDWLMVIAVAAVFVIGQAVEGNILTPRLVGGSVGLHPVWLLFALSAFGAVLGFTGLLIAVPAAAAIGVLGRFLLAQYKNGRLYRGAQAGGGRQP